MIVDMVRKYSEFLQVPQEWDNFEPPTIQEFMKTVVKPKTLPESENLVGEIAPKPPKDNKEHKKVKNLEKNLSNIKDNIGIIKDLIEPEYIYEEEIIMNSKSLQVIEGKDESKNDERPRIPFELGESSFIGICDLDSTINILPYHAYEKICYYLDDPKLEPTDATIRLSDRTSKRFCGILRNT
jgi:hypothetical protein